VHHLFADTAIPLHPGARAYAQEQGYIDNQGGRLT
jgi:TRAP-type uncharacterized transport system substrate-binding protein